MKIQIEIINKNEEYAYEDVRGVVELGRETSALEPHVRHCQIRDPYVSKHHLRVEPTADDGQVTIENISRRASIEVEILGVGPLAVGQRRVVDLPVQVQVGEYSIVGIAPDLASPAAAVPTHSDSLTSVAAPKQVAVDGTSVVRLFEDLDEAQTIVARDARRRNEQLDSKVPSDEVVRWLQTLAGVNRSSTHAEQFYNRSARAMVDLFGMDFGLVLRRLDDGWEQLASYPKSAEYSETVLSEVMAEKSTYIKTDRPDTSQSLAELESAVASPIFDDQERIVAVLYAARRRKHGRNPRPISALEARLVQVLATAVGAGLSGLESRAKLERVETELDLARKIQLSFFPSSMPALPEYELSGKARPAAAVGGDYYDVISLPDGKLGLVIADVCGHGVGPSLLMASLRATLRGLARKSVDAAETMTALNDMMFDDLHAQRKFVTLLFGWLDPDRHRFEYANAGHGPVVMHLEEGQRTFRLLHEDDQKNLPIGMIPCVEYKQCRSVELNPGDLIVLGSDGIVEINESYGVEELQESILSGRRQPVQQMVGQLLEAPLERPGRRRDDDDMTLLIARRK